MAQPDTATATDCSQEGSAAGERSQHGLNDLNHTPPVDDSQPQDNRADDKGDNAEGQADNQNQQSGQVGDSNGQVESESGQVDDYSGQVEENQIEQAKDSTEQADNKDTGDSQTGQGDDLNGEEETASGRADDQSEQENNPDNNQDTQDNQIEHDNPGQADDQSQDCAEEPVNDNSDQVENNPEQSDDQDTGQVSDDSKQEDKPEEQADESDQSSLDNNKESIDNNQQEDNHANEEHAGNDQPQEDASDPLIIENKDEPQSNPQKENADSDPDQQTEETHRPSSAVSIVDRGEGSTPAGEDHREEADQNSPAPDAKSALQKEHTLLSQELSPRNSPSPSDYRSPTPSGLHSPLPVSASDHSLHLTPVEFPDDLDFIPEELRQSLDTRTPSIVDARNPELIEVRTPDSPDMTKSVDSGSATMEENPDVLNNRSRSFHDQQGTRRNSYFDYLCNGLRHPFKSLGHNSRQKSRPTVNPQEFNANKAKLRHDVVTRLQRATREKWKQIEKEREKSKDDRKHALLEFREQEKEIERKRLIAHEKERQRQRLIAEKQKERNQIYATFHSELDTNTEAMQQKVAEIEEKEERIRRKMQLFIQKTLGKSRSRKSKVSPRSTGDIDTIEEEEL